MEYARRGFFRGFGLGLTALFIPGCLSNVIEPLFVPRVELWDVWSEHDSRSTDSVDHREWDRLLKTYVVAGSDGINRFAYSRVSLADLRALNAYIEQLVGTSIVRYNRNEQRAYWINLYNALTVKVVIEHYPVQTIRDIDLSTSPLSSGPWDHKLVRIGGHDVSLNDIEHRILRPIWLDPRIHYAVNCAALGCPNLLPEAFTAANIDSLMTRAAIEFINHPRGARVVDNGLVVSKIYLWYAEDFGETTEKIVAHLRSYARPEFALRIHANILIEDYAYDWSLNDAR